MTDSPSLDTVIVYADGAAKGNGGKNPRGGWGFRAEFAQGAVLERFGGETPSTNNRMELTAVIEALKALDRQYRVTVFTDSDYVVKGMTQWMPGWVRRGWKTASGEAVKNIELWQVLVSLAKQHKVEWRWVKGHAGHPGNERADALANQGCLA